MSFSKPSPDSVAMLLAPTITSLPEGAAGAVIVSGSHGGLYPGYCAAKAQLRAVIFHDAGVGKDQAGIASLDYLQQIGVAAATVSSQSCRIGDSEDMLQRGVISHLNKVAESAGLTVGMPCREAAGKLRQTAWHRSEPAALGEARNEVSVDQGKRRILLLDSAALVCAEDAGHLVVTGSHGALVGGKPAMALRTDGFAAVFHDAGGGIEGAGYTRLPALDERGIAAFTVAAASARIGDARSVYKDGIVSALNQRAHELGAAIGDRAQDILKRWACLQAL